MRPPLMALLVAAVLQGVAAAQDVAPVISAVLWNGQVVTKAPAGAMIAIVTSGFPPLDAGGQFPRGVGVWLRGESCPLFKTTADTIYTEVPPFGLKPGPAQLRVRVGGRITMVPFEVAEGRHPPMPAFPTEADLDAVRAQFEVARFDLVRDARGARIELAGTAPLPDHFSLTVSVTEDRRDLEVQRVTIRDGAWRATFGPYPEGPARLYWAGLLFELDKQPRGLARRFRSKLPPERSHLYDLVERSWSMVLPTPEEAGRDLLEKGTAALGGLLTGFRAVTR